MSGGNSRYVMNPMETDSSLGQGTDAAWLCGGKGVEY